MARAFGSDRGRRINQGFEGVALSPDGSRLFALLQSAAMQDSAAAQTRLQTRLLVYDVSAGPTPSAPVAEYALTLPTYRTFGDGGAVNATAAQGESSRSTTSAPGAVAQRPGNATHNSALNRSAACRQVQERAARRSHAAGNPTTPCGSSRDAEGGKIMQRPGPGDRRGAGDHEGSVEPAEFHSARNCSAGNRTLIDVVWRHRAQG